MMCYPTHFSPSLSTNNEISSDLKRLNPPFRKTYIESEPRHTSLTYPET